MAAQVAAVKACAGTAQAGRVVGLFFGGGVDDGVIDGDDLAGIFRRAGHIDAVAQRVADAVRNGGLAVAGRAVKQDRPPRGDGGAEVVDQVGRQDQVTHRAGQVLPGEVGRPDGLMGDLGLVLRQRHGGGAEVFGLGQRIERARLARIGQLEPHFVARCGMQGPRRLDKALGAGGVDQLLCQGRGQREPAREVRHMRKVHAEHGLEQEVAQQHRRQAGVGKAARLRRRGRGVGRGGVDLENGGHRVLVFSGAGVRTGLDRQDGKIQAELRRPSSR